MPTKSYRPNFYYPSSSRSGDNYPSVFRGSNGFFRGRGDQTFFECYGGSLNLNENIPAEALTGTISFSAASRTITGVGTSFQNELHLGQTLITIAGEVLRVEQVDSATSFIAHELPLTTGAAVLAYRMPRLFEMNNKRGTLLSGNAYEADTGSLLCVGSGTLRINGATISASLTASKQVKLAVFNAATGLYTIQQLGFSTVPVGVTIAAATAPAVKTFVDGDVTVGTDTVAIAAHGFNNGQKVVLTTSGVLPTGLSLLTNYFIIRTDANNIKFATTLANSVGTPVPINITTAAGGGTHTITPISKVMPAGDRSLLIAKASTKLDIPSYGNPSEKMKLTLTAGQGIAVTFSAMDSNADANNPHDAWRVYGTRQGGTTATATAAADSGAWYFVRTVTSSDLGGTAGGTYYLEYLDAEIDANARLASFDNDAPKRAEFIASLGGVPVLVSCQGKGTTDFTESDAPGAVIIPFKMDNFAAAPLVFDSGQRNEIPLSPPETIIGFYLGTGRIYLLTTNTLQIAAFTEIPFAPISTRPFWKSGFKNADAICLANYQLYGFTNSPIRSPEDGTDANTDRDFALAVKELTYAWHGSRTFVKHDPLNECVCYIYSGAYQNAAGFWVSLILPFMLELNEWSVPIIVSSDTQDMVISGAATVNGHLEFLAGGRDGAGGIEVRTYRFDAGGETVIPYSIAFQFSSGADEYRSKKIKYPRVTGKFTSANIGIHGAEASEVIDVAVLETSNAGSKSGSLPIANSTNITVYEEIQAEAKDLSVYSVAIFGTWDGVGIRDRLDEIVFTEIVQGSRR